MTDLFAYLKERPPIRGAAFCLARRPPERLYAPILSWVGAKQPQPRL